MEISDSNCEILKDMLEKDEKYMPYPYRDTQGKLTIGIGRNIEDRGISHEEARYLLENDINSSITELRAQLYFFDKLNDARKIVLINMCFNVGLPKLMQFRAMRNAIEKNDFKEAAKEMLDSSWAQEVGHRADRLAHIMDVGIL